MASSRRSSADLRARSGSDSPGRSRCSPALLVLVVGLAITVLGVLLIPFAIVAYVIAAAGLVTLGFLAVARLTGGALASDRGTTSPRGVHLRALVIGLGDLPWHLDGRGAVRLESGHRRRCAAPSPSRSPGSPQRSASVQRSRRAPERSGRGLHSRKRRPTNTPGRRRRPSPAWRQPRAARSRCD